MIAAIGVDIIEISRVEQSIERQGSRFKERVFTSAEIAYCEARPSRSASYAARFAAKEAAMKALGTGWGDGVGWQQVEIICGEKGAPSISLSGRALERLNELGAKRVHLSMSHSNDLAIAQVILES
ncbi:MAG TPA: holo-ACP synthase [Blastocatellia bacterium]|nr:holo-ACP synthase [Blastocatellia bacterium]